MTAATDHTGRVFPSVSEMALAWGLTPSALLGRIRRGWPLARALSVPMGTRPGHGPQRGIPARDHLGRDFPSMSAMAMAWGIKNCTLQCRLARGWGLEAALTVPAAHGTHSRDHLGRDYPGLDAMARAWGRDAHLVSMRLARGWTVERALTTPTGACGRKGV